VSCLAPQASSACRRRRVFTAPSSSVITRSPIAFFRNILLLFLSISHTGISESVPFDLIDSIFATISSFHWKVTISLRTGNDGADVAEFAPCLCAAARTDVPAVDAVGKSCETSENAECGVHTDQFTLGTNQMLLSQ
jgi:hypothetical protein